MALKFKPIYMCDGCGNELENPDEIRIFPGNITNGSKNKKYSSDEKMYCLNCIPLALDFKNETPETVKIIDDAVIKEQEQKPKSCPELDKIKKQLGILERTIEQLKRNKKEKIYVEVPPESKTYGPLKNDIPFKTLTKLTEEEFPELDKDILDEEYVIDKNKAVLDENIIDPDEEDVELLESSIDDDEDEEKIIELDNPIEEKFEDPLIKHFKDFKESPDDYEVFHRINTEMDKFNMIEWCQCKDLNGLIKVLQPHLPENVYYPIKQYVSEKAISAFITSDIETPLAVTENKVNTVENILFGVPNIVNRSGFVIKDYDNYIFIRKDDKIVPKTIKKISDGVSKTFKTPLDYV
jgi:hypothetical protein